MKEKALIPLFEVPENVVVIDYRKLLAIGESVKEMFEREGKKKKAYKKKYGLVNKKQITKAIDVSKLRFGPEFEITFLDGNKEKAWEKLREMHNRYYRPSNINARPLNEIHSYPHLVTWMWLADNIDYTPGFAKDLVKGTGRFSKEIVPLGRAIMAFWTYAKQWGQPHIGGYHSANFGNWMNLPKFSYWRIEYDGSLDPLTSVEIPSPKLTFAKAVKHIPKAANLLAKMGYNGVAKSQKRPKKKFPSGAPPNYTFGTGYHINVGLEGQPHGLNFGLDTMQRYLDLLRNDGYSYCGALFGLYTREQDRFFAQGTRSREAGSHSKSFLHVLESSFQRFAEAKASVSERNIEILLKNLARLFENDLSGKSGLRYKVKVPLGSVLKYEAGRSNMFARLFNSMGETAYKSLFASRHDYEMSAKEGQYEHGVLTSGRVELRGFGGKEAFKLLQNPSKVESLLWGAVYQLFPLMLAGAGTEKLIHPEPKKTLTFANKYLLPVLNDIALKTRQYRREGWQEGSWSQTEADTAYPRILKNNSFAYMENQLTGFEFDLHGKTLSIEIEPEKKRKARSMRDALRHARSAAMEKSVQKMTEDWILSKSSIIDYSIDSKIKEGFRRVTCSLKVPTHGGDLVKKAFAKFAKSRNFPLAYNKVTTDASPEYDLVEFQIRIEHSPAKDPAKLTRAERTAIEKRQQKISELKAKMLRRKEKRNMGELEKVLSSLLPGKTEVMPPQLERTGKASLVKTRIIVAETLAEKIKKEVKKWFERKGYKVRFVTSPAGAKQKQLEVILEVTSEKSFSASERRRVEELRKALHRLPTVEGARVSLIGSSVEMKKKKKALIVQGSVVFSRTAGPVPKEEALLREIAKVAKHQEWQFRITGRYETKADVEFIYEPETLEGHLVGFVGHE